MHETTSGQVFFRHRSLAEWLEVVTATPRGRAAQARRRALIAAVDVADVRNCGDLDVLGLFSDLLDRAPQGRDPASVDLVRDLPASRRATLREAAEAQLARLYLRAPEFHDSLEADLDLLRGCMEDQRRAG